MSANQAALPDAEGFVVSLMGIHGFPMTQKQMYPLHTAAVHHCWPKKLVDLQPQRLQPRQGSHNIQVDKPFMRVPVVCCRWIHMYMVVIGPYREGLIEKAVPCIEQQRGIPTSTQHNQASIPHHKQPIITSSQRRTLRLCTPPSATAV